MAPKSAELEAQAEVVQDHVPEVRRNVDIPDLANKDTPKAILSAEQKKERNLRRFTRKDGVFVKDFEKLFDDVTGLDASNRQIYKATKTLEEATEFVVILIEDTGRKLEKDPVTGRLKAVPGWNFDIHCPGMESVEQNAYVESESIQRQKRVDMLLEQSQAQVGVLTEQVKELIATVAELTGGKPAEGGKPIEDELDDASVAAADRQAAISATAREEAKKELRELEEKCLTTEGKRKVGTSHTDWMRMKELGVFLHDK